MSPDLEAARRASHRNDVETQRAYIEQWDAEHPNEPAPRDWYRSWELYLDSYRRIKAMEKALEGPDDVP
jgi:hypothetical protein